MSTSISVRVPCRWVVWRKNPESGEREYLDLHGKWGVSAFIYDEQCESDVRKDAMFRDGQAQCIGYRVKKQGRSTKWARIQLAKGKKVRSLITKTVYEWTNVGRLIGEDGTTYEHFAHHFVEVSFDWELLG